MMAKQNLISQVKTADLDRPGITRLRKLQMIQKIKIFMTTLHLKFKKLPVNVQQKQFVITV